MDSTSPSSGPSAAAPAFAEVPTWRRRLERAKDGVARAFGVDPARRPHVVGRLLQGHEKDAVTYWFQLGLAMAIATLGLVLGSTGVVIGAMLISPLMGPLVSLGMGLAVGSPLLVIRSATRTVSSIVFVVGAAALLTLLLPFQEVTGEIASRTSPTILDLLVAVCCALAAAFTTVRPGSDTASSAAGTAIGIALVPPLCVVGFGTGAGLWTVAGGAALLFTTNLCAILFVAAGFFVALGFDAVDVLSLEEEAGSAERPAGRVATRLRSFFGSRYGPLLRFAMPVVLLGAVAVPLGRALGRVSREVRVRNEVHRVLELLPAGEQAVRSAVTLSGGGASVRVLLVAREERAHEVADQLRLRVAAASGIEPKVDVVALPNLAAVEETASRLLTHAEQPPMPVTAPPPSPPADEVRRRVDAILRSSWPPSAGLLVGWRLGWDAGGPVIDVDALGAPIDAAAQSLLGRLFGDALQRPPTVRVRSLAPESVAEAGHELEWLPSLWSALDGARRLDGVRACVEVSARTASRAGTRRGSPGAAPGSLEQVVRASVEAMGGGRAEVLSTARYAVRLTRGGDCSGAAQGDVAARP